MKYIYSQQTARQPDSIQIIQVIHEPLEKLLELEAASRSYMYYV